MKDAFTAIVGVGVVLVYYVAAWLRIGRDPQRGPIVVQFKPPRDLSPAMMRYVWKERFDERVLWSGFLNLVQRGLASIGTEESYSVIHAVWPPRREVKLPSEEGVLYAALATSQGRKGFRLSLLDEDVSRASIMMAEALRKAAIGRFFAENRKTVSFGIAFSALAVVITAAFQNADELYMLLPSIAFMVLPAYYLYFLLQRFVDLLFVPRREVIWASKRRVFTLLLLSISCVAGIAFGCIFLLQYFGWTVIATLGALTGLNLLFLELMKAPTQEGRQLLDEIEGFRTFLMAVKRFPMNWPDAPTTKRGLYERYLPYALALEVEQQWCDQFNALASTDHVPEEMGDSHLYYLGMWDGQPIEVAWRSGHGGSPH